jgi:polysaccharide deacetylase family protein (PEP-CTERM system associated)
VREPLSAAGGGAPPCILTLDVEEWFHAHNYAAKVDAASWEGRARRAHEGVDRLLALCDELRIAATWFILGWLAEREPGIVRRIAAAGHEIGCHTYAHPVAYEQTPEQFRADTRRGRDAVGTACGRAPVAFRAASFTIVRRNYWALEVLREEGFRIDSSLFPVRHPRYGNPRGPREPFILGPRREDGLLVLPMTTLRVARTNLAFSGGGYFRLLPLPVLRACARRVRGGQREPVIFYFHPWELDPYLPDVDLGALQNLRSQGGKRDLHGKLTRALASLPMTTLGAWAEQLRPHLPLVARTGDLPG